MPRAHNNLPESQQSMAATERRKRWERRSEARPGELVAAALQLFAERGFAGTRLDDVAMRAGVSKATVYLYFESKERLFEAVVRESVTPNIDRIEALLDAYDGSTPNLLRALFTLVESVFQGPLPAVAKLVIAESGNFPELARLWANLVADRGLGVLRKIIQRGVDRGEFRPVNPADIAPAILAPVIMLALWKHSFGPYAQTKLDPGAVLRAHVETVIRGLAADQDAGAPPKAP